jgi:hypothetical protein
MARRRRDPRPARRAVLGRAFGGRALYEASTAANSMSNRSGSLNTKSRNRSCTSRSPMVDMAGPSVYTEAVCLSWLLAEMESCCGPSLTEMEILRGFALSATGMIKRRTPVL